ncbi:hypothetical protein D3C87_90070 [compost metagenome]
MASVEPIPNPQAPLSPYLCVNDGAKAIEFYKKAFGAEELYRLTEPRSGKVAHAEIKIGPASIMLADEYPDMQFLSPLTLKGTPITLHLYVKDVDSFAERAVAAGLKVVRKIEDQFYGDRGGKFQDPFGHVWFLSTQKEILSAEEIKKRADKMFGGAP